MKSFVFVTVQKVFGAYKAKTEKKAREMWAEEIRCDVEELPKCEVIVL